MSFEEQIGEIAMIFLAFRDQLKIYHWQTTNYARHKASDSLVGVLTTQMDRFMETIQGSYDVRMKIPNNKQTIQFSDQNDSNILGLFTAFKEWLTESLPSQIKPSDKDLSNIIDEILASVNNTIYLFTLK